MDSCKNFCLQKLLPFEYTATAKSLQLCLTLCDPIPGILQARTLEWVAISFEYKGSLNSNSGKMVLQNATFLVCWLSK